LERACYHNLSFMWLVSGTKPDYRTISRFRRENKEAIRQVLKQNIKFCIEFDLIDSIWFSGENKLQGQRERVP